MSAGSDSASQDAENVGSVYFPGGAIGTPMTYMVDGRQYVAVTVGGSPVPELVVLSHPVTVH